MLLYIFDLFKELQMFLHLGPGSVDGVGQLYTDWLCLCQRGFCHQLNRNGRIDTVSAFGLFLK